MFFIDAKQKKIINLKEKQKKLENNLK